MSLRLPFSPSPPPALSHSPTPALFHYIQPLQGCIILGSLYHGLRLLRRLTHGYSYLRPPDFSIPLSLFVPQSLSLK